MKALMTIATVLVMAMPSFSGDWPGFRGPAGTGVAEERRVPEVWSATENVTWKVALPGPGNSSPIVTGDRVIITQATEHGAKRSVMCFNRDDGKLLWERITEFTGEEPTHDSNPYCSATPVTDGKAVFVSLGSAGVVAYDLEGKELWRRDMGPMRHIWGNASSPVLYQDMVILLSGPGANVTLMALDKKSGEIIWQKKLAEFAGKDEKQWIGTWATPVIFSHDGRDEMVLPVPGFVLGMNPATGQEYWRCGGLSDLVYPSPMIGRDVIVAMSGYKGPAIGLRLPDADGHGDITATHRLWRVESNPQRVGTGVIWGENCYIANEPGSAECIDTHTGKSLWKERLGGTTWASTIMVDGKCYATDDKGTTYLFRPWSKFKLIGSNKLGEGDTTRATPAVSDGQIFIRTYKNLYCIGTRVK